MTASEKNWRDLFVGRKAELDWLKERWAKALEGDPQLVVLLAETGLGKTRIAQEFYRWLSREQDASQDVRPEGYWPDAFGSDRESLDVNPSFEPGNGTKGEIPWLWWGLRWEDPGKRNQIDDRCALSTYRSALLPHTSAIEAKKRSREIGQKAVWQVAETAASSVIPWAFALKDLFELGKDYRDVRKLSEISVLDPGSQKVAQEITLKDLALKDFRIILDPGDKDAPTVPVILLLDDAQWADSTSLAFVRELFAEARLRHWKLMVILTHWEQEWNTAPGSIDPKIGAVTHARQLPATLGLSETWQSASILIVHPLPEAEEIVRAAFPGLTDTQRKSVVEKSGGNAEMLKEALLWFESEPRFFVKGDRNQPLSEVGEKRLAEREFELAQFIRKRYERLSERVRRVLGWASAQGTRFLAEITKAAAANVMRSDPEKYGGPFDADAIQDALKQAEHPHSWIGFDKDSGRQNLASFRQRVFWEVAKDDLGFDPEERTRVESAIRDILSTWNATGQIDALPSAERLDALLIARQILRPSDKDTLETRRVWSRMMFRLFQEYRAEYQDHQAQAVAREWFDARPHGGWPFEVVAFHDQYLMLLLMHDRLDRSRTGVFVHELEDRTRKHAGTSPGRDAQRNLAAVVHLAGDIAQREGDFETARKCCKESLEIRRRILTDDGASLRSMRELCLSLDRTGDLGLLAGDSKTARASYEESLRFRRLVLERTGSDLQSQSELYVSLVRFGDLAREESDRVSARESYGECLSISQGFLEFWGTSPDALRRVAVAAMKLGVIDHAEGDRETARALFQKGLELCRRIVAEYRPSPQSLEDLSVSLEKVGSLDLELGDRESARRSYLESLELCRRIVEDFGEFPQSLRELSVSLDKMGTLELELGDRESARRSYLGSLEICRRIVAKYGESPQSLRDLGISLARVGVLEREDGERNSAREHLAECLEIAERSITYYGPSLERLRESSAALERLADLDRDLGELRAAKASYLKGLECSREILSKYGSTPMTLRDLSVYLGRLGELEHSAREYKSARAYHSESREVRVRILEEYGESPLALLDLFFAEYNLAGSNFMVPRTQEAFGWLEMAKSRLVQLRERGWATPRTDSAAIALQQLEANMRSGST